MFLIASIQKRVIFLIVSLEKGLLFLYFYKFTSQALIVLATRLSFPSRQLFVANPQTPYGSVPTDCYSLQEGEKQNKKKHDGILFCP